MRKLLALALAIIALTCAHPPQISQTAAASLTATQNGATRGAPKVKVWVNADSGVYHCPGTRWYGNTKYGEYMTQKQAQEKGNRPAYGRYCE